MDNLIYTLAVAIVLMTIIGFSKTILSILVKKLKSIQFKMEFSSKDKPE